MPIAVSIGPPDVGAVNGAWPVRVIRSYPNAMPDRVVEMSDSGRRRRSRSHRAER
jgi:hypothetical protein